MTEIRASCACGAIALAISSELIEMHHCHCSRCRKQHAAAFSTYAMVERSGFAWLRGAEQVRSFRSSPTVARTFCATCGSALQFIHDDFPDHLWIAVGIFDDVPELRPQCHVFVGARAAWHEITDALPCFEGPPI